MHHGVQLALHCGVLLPAVFSAARLNAQDQPAAPRAAFNAPRPAHERLAVFEGTWTRANLPPGQSFRETCAWLAEGRRHMICRQRSESPSGAMEQVVIYSYRGADAMYLVTVLLAGGQVWRYEGQLDGDRWVLNLVSARADSPQRLRQVVIPAGDTIRFMEEVSENGGPWHLSDPSEDYSHVRVPPTPR